MLSPSKYQENRPPEKQDQPITTRQVISININQYL